MTLLCWNVAGRVKRLREQADLVTGAELDLVCLQEISAATAAGWTERLAAAGWTHVALTDPPSAANRRPLRVLTATRSPFTIIDVPGVPWPERVLALTTQDLELVNVHSPISARPDLVKVRTSPRTR